jgi:hypothetical protein
MTDTTRPADHPLVEFAYDLLAEINRGGIDTLTRSPVTRRHVRAVLRSARALISALEDLVDELDEAAPPTDRANSAANDVDFQRISLD